MSVSTDNVIPRVAAPAPPRATGRTKPACRHCGAPLIDARMNETGFCCAGCAYVYRLVHEHGLAGYYRIKDDVTVPADTAVFQPRDYGWLESAQQQADAAPVPVPELAVDVQGISCAGCVWLIERIFQQQPGARDVIVNPQYGTMRMRWVRGEFSAARFAATLQGFGYLIGPAGETPVEPEARRLVKRIGLCAAFAMNVMLYALPNYFGMESTFEWAGLFALLALVFGTLSFLVGGTYFVGRAFRALREGAMHIDLPIAIGVVGAYLGSLYGWLADQERFVYFDFVSTFILLMLIGRWAQVAAVERNQRRLLSQQPKPQRVRLADGGEVPPEQLASGQGIALSTGQTLPVESRLESEGAAFSLASINGEAEPRNFHRGQRIPAGAVNVTRRELRLTTMQTWDESLLAQLLLPGQRASERHRLLEQIVRGYLIAIIGLATLSGVGWWLMAADPLQTWSVVTAVLVVSCPCAIGLAFPLADEMATVALRRRGVFIREDDLWSKLARVRTLAFDKTGTLTLETPTLQNPHVLRELDETARGALLALSSDNPHPVSQCLRENLLAFGRIEAVAGEVRETVGFGVELGPWSLGRAGWRNDRTGSDTVFARDGEVLARFRFVDAVRSDARAEVAELHRRGFEIFILSGDNEQKVRAMAGDLGLPASRALGAMTPQAKAAWMDARPHADTMMLGDGANDSLAFDRALVRGTPVIHRGILERKADFYYLGRGISGLRALFDIDRVRRRTQIVILVFSIVYNLVAVGLAVAGRMNPLLAAALMPINSLITLALVTGGMRPAFAR